MKPKIDKLKIRRDSYLAHNDKVYFQVGYFDPDKEYYLGPSDLRILLFFAENLCRDIFSLIDSREPCFRIKNSGDLNKLLNQAKNNVSDYH